MADKPKHLTVGKLKKALRGLPNDMPVFTMDHDHSEWETNGRGGSVDVRDQSEGKYLTINAN